MKNTVDNAPAPGIELLLANERNIAGLKDKLNNCKMFERIFIKKRWENRLKDCERTQHEKIDLYLMKQDEDFAQLADENYQLLKGNSIFTVYSEAITILGNYTKKMKGYLHDNGYCYAETIETNNDLLNIDEFAFPAEYTGKINFWGEMNLTVSKVEHTLINNASFEFLSKMKKEI